MGASDKFSAGMDKVVGQVKETVGKLTDNERLEAEGKLEKAKGDAKQAGEKAKDAAKEASEKAKDAAKDLFD